MEYDTHSGYWEGTMPAAGGISYFVQAADRSGNTSLHTGKAAYTQRRVYLPLVMRQQ